MKQILFISALIFIMLFSSCVESVNVDYHRVCRFDEQAFLDASSDWAKMNISDYAFSYMFWTSVPNAVAGDVTAYNSVGTVKLTLDNIWTKDDKEYEKQFQHYKDIFSGRSIALSSIEEVFKLIADSVAIAKIRFDNNELIYYKMDVKYDETYHYPKQIIETISKTEKDVADDVAGDWSGGLHVQITAFRIQS